MSVRGAPAIGITAAYGVALAAVRSKAKNSSQFMKEVSKANNLTVIVNDTKSFVDPFQTAIRKNLDGAVEMLVKAGAEVDLSNIYQAVVVFWDNSKVLENVLKAKNVRSIVNEKDEYGITPLMHASTTGNGNDGCGS